MKSIGRGDPPKLGDGKKQKLSREELVEWWLRDGLPKGGTARSRGDFNYQRSLGVPVSRDRSLKPQPRTARYRKASRIVRGKVVPGGMVAELDRHGVPHRRSGASGKPSRRSLVSFELGA